MPQRGIETSYWGDPFVQKLPFAAKGMYIYLWTNAHCNQAGLYEITPETIAFETGLPLEDIPHLIQKLEPKVAWYPEQNLVWVKNFLKYQSRSPKFLTAAAKNLNSIRNNGLIKEFLDYNKANNILIPYPYRTSTVAIPYSSGIDTSRGIDTPFTTGADTGPDSRSDKGDGDSQGEGEKAGVGTAVEFNDKEMAVISQLYEANIGMLTPIIAEELRDVRARYPPGWFGEAVKEALASEHRNLKYIEAILERWKTEGFKSRTKGRKGERHGRTGEHRQNTESDTKPHEWTETPEDADFSR
jgi:DnaD/phage-associated family protein